MSGRVHDQEQELNELKTSYDGPLGGAATTEHYNLRHDMMTVTKAIDSDYAPMDAVLFWAG